MQLVRHHAPCRVSTNDKRSRGRLPTARLGDDQSNQPCPMMDQLLPRPESASLPAHQTMVLPLSMITLIALSNGQGHALQDALVVFDVNDIRDVMRSR